MLLFSIFVSKKLDLNVEMPVTYSSAIQIKGYYNKNRLTVSTEDLPNEKVSIYSTRPPFENGWIWVVEPPFDDISFARQNVTCGSNISLKNPHTNYYLSVRQSKRGKKKVLVIPTAHRLGENEQWTIGCENPGAIWVRDMEITLQNVKTGCFLTTGVKNHWPNDETKYNVTCSGISSDAIWAAAEGIYFGPPLQEEKNFDDNL